MMTRRELRERNSGGRRAGVIADTSAGFTLIELLVSISIFVFMTAFLVAKYGGFNQSVLITNSAYDVALTIRGAQSYGLNVKGADVTGSSGTVTYFSYPYGAHFSSDTTTSGANTSYVLFADTNLGSAANSYSIYDPGTDIVVSKTTLRQGTIVSSICVGNDEGSCVSSGVTSVDISFRRPDPDAIITANGASGRKYPFAKITVLAANGSMKSVSVRSTGQISIVN